MEKHIISKLFVDKSRSPIRPLECFGKTENGDAVYIRFRNNSNVLKVIVGWVPLEHTSDTSTAYEFSVPETQETRSIGDSNDDLLRFLKSHLQNNDRVSLSERITILENEDEDIATVRERVRLHLKSIQR